VTEKDQLSATEWSPTEPKAIPTAAELLADALPLERTDPDCLCGAIPSLTECVCGGIRPCGNHPEHIVLTIGLFPVDGQTEDETYTKWCHKTGINPWCGNRLERCPLPERA
jgi:hypothetical protein